MDLIIYLLHTKTTWTFKVKSDPLSDHFCWFFVNISYKTCFVLVQRGNICIYNQYLNKCVSLPRGYGFHLCSLVKFCETPSKKNMYCKRFILFWPFPPSEFQENVFMFLFFFLKKKKSCVRNMRLNMGSQSVSFQWLRHVNGSKMH